MFRNTQTLPGGALTLLGVVALSLFVPGWTASALGLRTAHAHLIAWMFSQQGLFVAILLLLYGLIGFGIMVGAGVAIYSTSLVSMRALNALRAWSARTSVTLAQWLGELLYWPVQMLKEQLSDQYQSRSAYLTALLDEQRELRRIYREDFAARFPSYLAFLRDWRARKADAPLQQAIRLMGLPENFSRQEVKERFRTLIDRIHPDKIGPNELATQLIDAYKLICSRKKWK